MGKDLNLRRTQGPTGLQPVAFDRSATHPTLPSFHALRLSTRLKKRTQGGKRPQVLILATTRFGDKWPWEANETKPGVIESKRPSYMPRFSARVAIVTGGLRNRPRYRQGMPEDGGTLTISETNPGVVDSKGKRRQRGAAFFVSAGLVRTCSEAPTGVDACWCGCR